MKRVIALVLCLTVILQCSVVARAEEVFPYDEDAVIDIEFPGFYDAEQDCIVMYDELIGSYSLTITAGTYMVVGGMLCLMMYFQFITSEQGQSASRALCQMITVALNDVSDACGLFMQEVGEMFIKGKAISQTLLESGADYIAELKDAFVTLISAEDETFSFTKGSAGSLVYDVSSDELALRTTWPGYTSMSNHTTQPWLYASASGAALWVSRRYYSGSGYTYYWHGLSSDEYGDFWYYFESSSLYGYTYDNISYNSYVAIPDGVTLRKFYLQSASAYNAAIGTQTKQYFLQANSVYKYYDSDYQLLVGYYNYNGGLASDNYYDTNLKQTYWSPAYCFVPASVSVPIEITVTDTEATYTDIPGGLVLDSAATEAEVDLDALAYRVADILEMRLAGTEKSEAAEAEKMGILQSIYQAVNSIAESLGGVFDGAVEEVEALAPVQAVQDKFTAVTLIYDTFSAFLEKITTNVEPPVIYVDMTKSESSIITSDNDKIPILDMSFYEPYKPYGDTIISGVLWTFFLWRLFSRLPDIISGVGMTVESNLTLDDRKAAVKDRRERRNKRGGN